MDSGHVPRVSVSIAVHDGLRWLPGCFDTLATQTISDLEILVLEDASSDGSDRWLAERARADARIDLETSEENIGYARAHNRNIRRASGPAVLLLNQDMELDAGFLEAALGVLDARPRVAAVQGHLRTLGEDGIHTLRLDSTGLEWHRDRHVSIRDHGGLDEADGPPPTGGPIWGADGPAPLLRTVALRSAELPARGGGVEFLDEDFVMYKEDVDLAWRLRRLGWQAWYEPTALGWHARTSLASYGGSLRSTAAANAAHRPTVRRHSYRNQRLMQVKNDPFRDVLRDLPLLITRELAELAYLLVRDRSRLGALPGLIAALPWALRKRRALRRAVTTRSAAPQTPGHTSGLL